MNPYISFIVPVYNVEKYLERCIKSILIQKIKDWELILVNDGSTDNSINIINYYIKNDSRIRVVNSKNFGVSHARNIGIKLATGKYISFIDSDDELESNAINIFSKIENNYKASIYKFGYKRINKDNELDISSPQSGIYNISEGLLNIEKNMYSGFLWNSIFRREIIHKYNIFFDESISWCEDHIFFLEYLTHCDNIYISNSIYYKYYIGNNPTSLSSIKRSPFLYIDIGKREFYLKNKCNTDNIKELKIIIEKGFNEKCILAINNAILQQWQFKDLFLLYKDIHKSFSFTNKIYFCKNKLIFLLYCMLKKIKTHYAKYYFFTSKISRFRRY